MINTFGNYGYSVKLTSVRNTDSVEKYLEIAGRRDSSAFVLLMPRAREIVSAFQLTGKPVLVLFPQGRFVNVNQLVDSPHLVELQFNHLYELGHRQILYLQDCWQSQSRTQAGRVLDYYRLMSRNGIPVPSHWQTDYRNGALCDVLAQAFSRQPWPTGLIVSDSAVSAVYDFLRRRNLVIGRDVSVVATDGVSFLEPLSPSVSTTVMNGVHISDMAWKLLNKQFKGDKGFECKEVEIEFKQGGSSGRKQ